ncbi:MAG: hypothetical protein KatS3mg035_2084 [Bacteroidia bacterium]|nr:MAG: hypothetical protein KatS3mg035_2084 [Bacteroidia bacterium]
MNWKEIKVSEDNTHFLYEGKPLFNKKFLEVLKFHEPGLAPVKDETGWYHIPINGTPLYQERYDRAFGFYCNRATVVKANEWFHINEKGQRVYTQNYAWTGNFQENLCTVRNHQNFYFHIDLDGNRVYSESYLYAGDFKDGYACVKCSDGLFRHIDTQGKFLNEKGFLDLGVFHKGFATAKDKKGWFHINKQGTELYSQRYLMIEPFYNGCALVTTFDNHKIIIDENGKKILNI